MINNNRCALRSSRIPGDELCPEMLSGVLDHLPFGVALLDATGVARFLNKKLMRILDAKDGLCLDSKRICAQRLSDVMALNTYLAAAAHDSKHGVLAIPRPSGRMPYLLGAQPLAAREVEEEAAASGIRILLFVTDSEEKPVLHSPTLKQAFGFTAKEAELASLLCQGASLMDAAPLMGVARSTVRRHLEQIFRKSNVRSQAELIGLLVAGLAPLSQVELPPLISAQPANNAQVEIA